MTPRKFTVEELRPTVITAIEIARAAPKEGRTYCALIPWSLIRALRHDLEHAGIEWRDQ